MSDKISAFPPIVSTDVVDADLIPIVHAGATNRIPFSELKNALGAPRYPVLPGELGVTDTSYPPKNVKRYGALGNDAADDTAAIQAAMNYLSPYGGDVIVPAGFYRYTQLTYNEPNLKLRGEGYYSTKLRCTVTNASAIICNAGYAGMSNIGLDVVGTPTAGSILLNVGTASYGSVFEDLRCTNFYDGIRASTGSFHRIVLDTSIAGGTMCLAIDAIGTTWENIDCIPRASLAACFHVQGQAAGVTCDTNHFNRCATSGGAGGNTMAFRISRGGTSGIPRWTRVHNCMFETANNVAGVHVMSIETSRDLRMTASYVSGGHFGIVMSGPTADWGGNTHIEATIFGSSAYGFYHIPADTTSRTMTVDLSGSTIGDHATAGVLLGATSRGFKMTSGSNGPSVHGAVQPTGFVAAAGATDFNIGDAVDMSGYSSSALSGVFIPTIASASTIAPTNRTIRVSGTTAIDNITASGAVMGQLTVIPTGIFTTTTAGNIALASTAVISKALIFTYDSSLARWYPSY